MDDMMSALNRKLLARKKMAESGDDEKPANSVVNDEQAPRSQPPQSVNNNNNKAPSSPFSTRSNSVKAPAVAPGVKNSVSRTNTSASSATDDTSLNNLREELIKVIRDEVQAAKEEIIEVLRQELRK
jgi:hypothetical protein